MERLNPLDAGFVDAEDQDEQASFATASGAVFGVAGLRKAATSGPAGVGPR